MKDFQTFAQMLEILNTKTAYRGFLEQIRWGNTLYALIVAAKAASIMNENKRAFVNNTFHTNSIERF